MTHAQDQLSIAYSPCPNDTFIFHAWAHGLIPGAPVLAVTTVDIDVTNKLAEQGSLDILKVSYAALPYMLDTYALLPCGGAVGRGCGPLVLTRDAARPEDLRGRTVAVPSTRSTAHLLFRLWAARAVPGGVGDVITMPFHDIMPAVRDGEIGAGLVIHEARFTYAQFGLHCVADMGEAWEAETGHPIPLGAIVARRALGPRRLGAVADAIRASVRYAWDHPSASREYVMDSAEAMSPEVADQHIGLYVNEYSADLGKAGMAAVRALLGRAAAEGLVPRLAEGALDVPFSGAAG